VRLVVLKYAYPTYLRRWYAGRPHEGDRSYAEQRAALEADSFWWGGSWSGVLPNEGIEVTELIENAQPLQRAWAREHGVEMQPYSWMTDIVRRQIAAARPDALLIQSFWGLPPEVLATIRAENPGLRAVVGWVGSPNVSRQTLALCDHVLTCVPEQVDELTAVGLSCSHMHHAFERRVLDRIGPRSERDLGFTFVGAVLNHAQHGPRMSLIREVASRSDLQVFAHAPRIVTSRRGVITGRTVYAVNAGLRRAGVSRETLLSAPAPTVRRMAMRTSPPRYIEAPAPRARVHPAAYGLQMFGTLRRSVVTLNVHSTISPISASNLRMFEAPGVGTCLLTDWRRNIADLFEPDREVVTYRSVAECVERATWLVNHPAEAERIGAAAMRRTLAQHTFAHRAPVLAGVLRQVLAWGSRTPQYAVS